MSLVVYSFVMFLQIVPRMHETKRQHHTMGVGGGGDTTPDTVQKEGKKATITHKKTELIA